MHISHWLLHTEEFSSENASAGCPRKMHYGRISQPLDGKGTEQATSNGNECCSRLFEPEFSLPPAPSFIPASPRPHFEQFYGIQMDSVARNGQKTKPKGKALRYRFMQIAAESIQYPARPDMQQTVDCRNFTEPHEGVGEGGGRGGEFGGACALQK